MLNKIYPCLWFDGKAKEAAELYCSAFNHAVITVDTSMVVIFELNGHKFMGLNGGPAFVPNPSISFFVVCETPAEIENAWQKLVTNGKVLMPLDKYEWSARYGWVQDQFGISWQLALGKLEEVGQKISPCLMFANEKAGAAEQAIHFYTSVFNNASVVGILKYTKKDEAEADMVQHAQFKLEEQVFMAMDSPMPHAFGFNEGISFVVDCKTQEEIDYYWQKLTAGGHEDRCGWLTDQYGVSWQIVPSILGKLMSNPEKAPRVTKAFMQMKKFDIETLVNA